MRHLVLALHEDQFLTDSELARLTARVARWRRGGGLLVLPPGAILYDVGTPERVAPPDGVSLEGVDWAVGEMRDAD